MKSKHWMYLGCGVIGASNLLQLVGAIYPSLSVLSIAGTAFNMISIPATIVQAQKSGIENQQQFDQERTERNASDQRVWEMTEPGKAHIEKQKILHSMRKTEQSSRDKL